MEKNITHETNNNLQTLVETNDFIRQLSIDCVIFGFHNKSLKVLMLKYFNLDIWALPGGFIFRDENVDDAAYRLLYERTHLNEIFLEQFYTFGNKNRTESDIHNRLTKNKEIDLPKDHWLFERHISIGYYALIDYTLSSTFPDAFSEKCEWFDVHNLPKEIAFDHREIIEKGMEFLRKNLDYKIYGSNLLPEKFTMKELQNLYECILGEPLRRNNFQRKMLSLDFLERLEKKFDGSANKAPYYYKFKK
ncbi:NUDIX hydrolase [Elizabethkingia ursingii]|uniref:NUDIX hydrolase n=1 Tax=Elizabethkingia ursingii TaxID=1756150 RepID=A0AAJ3NE59_9FLAO|nr:NUDIX domain-containing protein [Elizabethkingia ursingii]AQX08621.1 NUDIX hydrolase [Elizabethkingia ursingii]KUY26188.1 NUDIX hydrolase [Elizabethkingia ursingii]MCL1673374.1 NUDIX domain-containing protein [Elizabethkingia ursingii]OPB77912.1 NUDIX hydrolase [Elizabethkingia ursingii]